jgi:hypothetical protein
MKKVKSRKVPAKATRAARAAAGGRAQKAAAKPGRKAKARQPTNSANRRPASPSRGGAKKENAERPELQIRELDPLRVCGGRTSVTQLFRVDEQLLDGKAAGARQVHLVFNDRHGWYCEHGRSCHAVSAVMRHAGIR